MLSSTMLETVDSGQWAEPLKRTKVAGACQKGKTHINIRRVTKKLSGECSYFLIYIIFYLMYIEIISLSFKNSRIHIFFFSLKMCRRPTFQHFFP